ncbi:MAG: hypothetical protein GX100_03845 [candidate division WS1 bacterium]|nr:hypothetical protein [candidate division WS1 bacterium]
MKTLSEPLAPYAETLSFLHDLWLSERAPERPALVFVETTPAPPPPDDPDPLRARALAAQHAALHGRVCEGTDYVPLLSTNNGTEAMASAFGAVLQEHDGRYWAERLFHDLHEADGLEVPPVEGALVGEALEHTRLLRQHTELPIMSLDLQSPLTVATQLLGVSELFMAMYDDPRRVHALLEVITEFFIRVVETQQASAGEFWAPVFWPGIWSPPEVGLELADDYMLALSPELFDEFSLPYLSRLAEHFGGLFLHSCSIYSRNLPSLKKVPNLRGINSDLSMSCPVREILDALPGVVVTPHIYMNKEITHPTQQVWLRETLEAWRPGDRLFPYVLAVMYDPPAKAEVATDFAEVRKVIPASVRRT